MPANAVWRCIWGFRLEKLPLGCVFILRGCSAAAFVRLYLNRKISRFQARGNFCSFLFPENKDTDEEPQPDQGAPENRSSGLDDRFGSPAKPADQVAEDDRAVGKRAAETP